MFSGDAVICGLLQKSRGAFSKEQYEVTCSGTKSLPEHLASGPSDTDDVVDRSRCDDGIWIGAVASKVTGDGLRE